MGRAPCCDKNGLKKGPWTPDEDHKLTSHIQIHGPGNWRNLPKNAGLERCGKSCRLRWTNYLRPDIKRGRFSFEEEETIIQLHSILGNKWSAIAARLPGRTDNEIKNYWNTHIRKRLLRMGIDPVTHTPRLDLLDISSIFTTALRNQSLLNLTSLLGSNQSAILNPDLMKLISTLLSPNPKQESADPSPLLLQNFQPNQSLNLINNAHHQQLINPSSSSSMQQISNQERERLSMDMITQFIQLQDNNVDGNSNSIVTQHQPMTNLISCPCPTSEVNINNTSHVACSSSLSLTDDVLVNQPDYYKMFSDSELMSNAQKSSTPLNSSSTHINNSSSSSTEDERDSYCSDFLKFEIPEGLDFADFM